MMQRDPRSILGHEPGFQPYNDKKRRFDDHNPSYDFRGHKKPRRGPDEHRRGGGGGGGRRTHNQKPGTYEHQQREQHAVKDFLESGPPRPSITYAEALERLPKPTAIFAKVPHGYLEDTAELQPSTAADAGAPPLPPILDPALQFAPFLHKSVAGVQHSRTSAVGDISYERLELLGDAYIELFASRLLFHRYPNLPAGRQSQLRELLVKNETLAQYSKLYGFDKKIRINCLEQMLEEASNKGSKGNKGIVKVLGDVFEAYTAAVILADPENGVTAVEKWLTLLWAPKLVETTEQTDVQHVAPIIPSSSGYIAAPDAATAAGVIEWRSQYNPNAKIELQKRILGRDVRLEYEKYKDSVELKGDKLGQNRHFIALYLTGHGYERKLLGQGEGRNKLEAGNWAAQEAMHGECKEFVDEAEKQMAKLKEQAKKAREKKKKDEARSRSTEDGLKEGGQQTTEAEKVELERPSDIPNEHVMSGIDGKHDTQ